MHESINYFENGDEPENCYLREFSDVANPIVSISFTLETFLSTLKLISASIYLFKVNNESHRTIREICSKFGVVLVSLLLDLIRCVTLFWFFDC